MQLLIKDITFDLEPQTAFARLTVGSRECAVSALIDADDLERMARIFAHKAKKLRGDV